LNTGNPSNANKKKEKNKQKWELGHGVKTKTNLHGDRLGVNPLTKTKTRGRIIITHKSRLRTLV